MTLLLYISALMLFVLACGVSSQLPPKVLTSSTLINTETSTHVNSVEMVVVADTALNIRADHTEKSDDIGDLFIGDVVTCKLPFTVVGESIWCEHERGWSNVRWLRVKEELK